MATLTIDIPVKVALAIPTAMEAYKVENQLTGDTSFQAWSEQTLFNELKRLYMLRRAQKQRIISQYIDATQEADTADIYTRATGYFAAVPMP